MVCRIAFLLTLLSAVLNGQEKPFGLAKRTPWTTSRVRGTPEPPLPFRAARVFPTIRFDKPVTFANAPGTKRIFVVEQLGKIFSIDPAAVEPRAELFLDAQALAQQLRERDQEAVNLEAVYGLAFHPKFAENREVFVCYTITHRDGSKGAHANGTRVVRLRVSKTDPPRAEPASEQLILTWLQGGHNGGSIKFGPEGFLYISTGDGGQAFPPDGHKTGQSLDDLLSSVLRVDVDRPQGGRHYTIPADNPFVDTPGARGEVWAYGMRNPWKISFDRESGALWVGDVGWELWELVYRVRKGDNFGWSIQEGRQPVNTEWSRGPTPITAPTVEIPHTDGASITGGYVYRGKKFPELIGKYIFGDWETRRVWAVKAEGDPGPHEDICDPSVRIIDFGEDNDGELYLLDYDDGTLHQFVRNEAITERPKFPVTLSETGLFASTADHTPAAGVLPFSINAEQWADFATQERWIGVPGDAAIQLFRQPKPAPGSMFSRSAEFPLDTTLLKTLSLEMTAGDPRSSRRIETQLLHFNGRDWLGYTYEWNDAQTDATLVPRGGKERLLTVVDASAPDGKRLQPWKFFSRGECIRCHNPWAEGALAFTLPQLNRDHDFGGVRDNQIRAYRHAGLFQEFVEPEDREVPALAALPPKSETELPLLANPYDYSDDPDRRARAYLHVNCAHCHRFGGGGSAYVHLNYELPAKDLKAIGVRPAQGTFGIHDAQVIRPGDPFRSTLYLRLAKVGPGHMPALGGRQIDRAGVSLMHDWIIQLPERAAESEALERLIALDEGPILAREASEAIRLKYHAAREQARRAQRPGPSDEDLRGAETKVVLEAKQRADSRARDRDRLAREVLSSPSRTLLLVRALDRQQLPPAIREQVLAVGSEHEDLVVRDLLEPFLPAAKRAQRLGETVDAAAILKLAGDAARGKKLYFEASTVQCRNCHKIGEQGQELGPELTHIAKKKDRAKLLEALLDPSKEIDPKFGGWIVETKDGRVLTGLLVKRDEQEVVLRDVQRKEHRFAPHDLEQIVPQQKSLMPELLLRDMTAEQVADLLAFLSTLH